MQNASLLNRTCRVTLLALFGVGILTRAVAQGTPDSAVGYILFFSSHCQEVVSRGTGSGQMLENTAQRMGVTVSEVEKVDRACTSYLLQETKLRDEALQKHKSAEARHKTLTSTDVQSFSDRRMQLANAAMEDLKVQLTPSGYASILRYIDSSVTRRLRSLAR